MSAFPYCFPDILWISWTETNGKLPAHRAGLPGNVDIIRGSALLPTYKAGYPADLPVMMSKIHVI